MGEGVAMRHTCNRRVEDAEEVGPPRGGPPGWRGVGPLSPSNALRLQTARGKSALSHSILLTRCAPAKVRVQGRSTWLDEDQARGGRWGGGLWRLWRGCERMGPIVAPQQVLGNGLEFLRRNELLGSRRLHPERIFSFPASHGGPVAHPAHRARVHQRVDTILLSQF